MTVDIFIPCFIDQMFPETGMNMVRVLEKAGCTVNYNPEQTCCGQPAFNGGFWDEAREVGEKFIKEFAKARYIVVPSASCAGMIKNYYPKLFHNSSLHNEYTHIKNNMFELSDFLVNVLKKTNFDAQLFGKATYHDSCAALREYGIKTEPRDLLKNIEGLELTEMEDCEVCCGFGGTFAVKYEPISVAMAEKKVDNAIATGADYLISTDLSCLMHMDGYIKKKGHKLQVMHLADALVSGW